MFESMIAGYVASKADKGVDKVVEKSFERLFEHILKNPWRFKSKKGEKLIRSLKEDGGYDNYVNGHIYENLKTKTIDGKDSLFVIDDIYYPLRFKNNNNESVLLENMIMTGEGCILNITGVAGNGKSTVMKKLLIETIRKGLRLPFFLELRTLEDNSIVEKLVEIINNCGVKADIDSVESALSSSRIILLLDGFDEISSGRRKVVYKEIELIKNKFKAPILISSRPHTEICTSTIAQEIKIQDLSPLDVFNLIDKRMGKFEAEKAKQILKSNNELLTSLVTPILVSLFCACYPNADIIPKTASDYYQRIFDILYEGHDLRKLFFSREKAFHDDSGLVKAIFCAFSFLSLKENKLTITHQEAIDFIDKSMNRCGYKPKSNDTSNFLQDIIKITGLIKEDGFKQYAFIHKSIQEYHAALFIKNSDDDAKKSINQSILNGLIDGSLKNINVSSFLFYIDKLNTIRNISIPLFESIGFSQEVDVEELTRKLVDDVLCHSRAGVVVHAQHEEALKPIKGNKAKVRKKEIFILRTDVVGERLVPLSPFISIDKDKTLRIADMVYTTMNSHVYLQYYVNKVGVNRENKDLDASNSLLAVEVVDHFCHYHKVFNLAMEMVSDLYLQYVEQKAMLESIKSTEDSFSGL